MSNLADMQKNEPDIKIAIQTVGIKNLKLPIYIKERGGGVQHSVADIDVFVDVAAKSKGTHMSRLAIGIQKFSDMQFDAKLMKDITEYIKNKCDATRCQLKYRFPYFIRKLAPVSKEPGMTYCEVEFDYINRVKTDLFTMNILITATSLCPCSKEISEGGAHNQRSKIHIHCKPKNDKFVWIEDLVEQAEVNSSCEVFTVLKRSDEKWVTDQAYDNPNFVEDMVRKIYSVLALRDDLDWFTISVTNEESIHQHDAYALMSNIRES